MRDGSEVDGQDASFCMSEPACGDEMRAATSVTDASGVADESSTEWDSVAGGRDAIQIPGHRIPITQNYMRLRERVIRWCWQETPKDGTLS